MLRRRKNVAGNARKGLDDVFDEARTRVFGAERVPGIVGNGRKILDLPFAVFQMQQVWTTLSRGPAALIERRRINPRPTVVHLDEVHLELNLLVTPQRIKNRLSFLTAFGGNVGGGFRRLRVGHSQTQTGQEKYRS